MSARHLIQASASRIPIASESVQAVVTSPPYWGLRQYAGEQREVWGGAADCAHEWGARPLLIVGRNDTDRETPGGRGGSFRGGPREAEGGGFCACGAWYGALGLEPTPELYVEHIVQVFREVRRVLRKDGVLFLNLGDSYASSGSGVRPYDTSDRERGGSRGSSYGAYPYSTIASPKPKDLVGIPWMVAFALRADGWYLRSDIIWHKPNPMPESVTDRPTKAHEYLFLLSKSERYFYDADAIREPHSAKSLERYEYGLHVKPDPDAIKGSLHDRLQAGIGNADRMGDFVNQGGRNKRTVWTIATRPYPGAHFATYPEQLVEPCILAGTSPKACGVCGAPWERVTEKGEPEGRRDSDMTDGFVDFGMYQGRACSRESKTLGWRSTCEHEDDSGACVVLDPFNGSGTTGRVAIRHGRSYIGVDISSEYLVEQATKRIDNIQHVMGL